MKFGMIMAAATLGLAISSVSQASVHNIKLEDYFYSSPATMHLKLIQNKLAKKAIAVCGSQDAVKGIINIELRIFSEAEDRRVGGLSPDGKSLDLWYPRFITRAVVECGEPTN
jgi:hypothetical protein